jgi:hypothetical protein
MAAARTKRSKNGLTLFWLEAMSIQLGNQEVHSHTLDSGAQCQIYKDLVLSFDIDFDFVISTKNSLKNVSSY